MLAARLLMFEEMERQEAIRQQSIMRRTLRDSQNPMDLPANNFIEFFRLNKEVAGYLLAELTPHMQARRRMSQIHPHVKIFAALRFYATGDYQRSIGSNPLHAVSQVTISRAIKEVTEAIYNNMVAEWIKFPKTANKKLAIKQVFMEKTRFPGVIGCIDCTHVSILAPPDEHNYVNRKGYHSKNVQIVCDYDLNILSINARYAGATHDSYIWRNSVIQQYLQSCHAMGERSAWLLGDSGYPQQPWLMTPINNAEEDSPEERYNERHIAARNCIERCNGVIKNRFRCLSSDRMLRYKPAYVGKIITVCAVLHNLCINARIPNVPFEDYADNGYVLPPQQNVQDNIILGQGRAARARIVQQYFTL